MKFGRAAAVLWVGVLSGGCAIETADPEPGTGAGGAGAIATTVQELSTCSPAANCGYSNILHFDVDPSESAKWGPPASEYLCWATRAEPWYSGGGPKLRVKQEVNRDGVTYWNVQGSGRMSCVKQCCFSSNGGANDVRWLSGNIEASQTGSGCSWNETNAWWADALTMVQGVDFPHMEHAADKGYTAGGSQTSPVKLRTSYCGGTGTLAYSYGNSFFVGIPGGGHYKKTSAAKSVGLGSPTSYQMIPVTQGICYFEKLGGYIDAKVAGQSGTRWVKIEPVWNSNDYYWVFARSDPYYLPPEATARCYYYNQSQ